MQCFLAMSTFFHDSESIQKMRSVSLCALRTHTLVMNSDLLLRSDSFVQLCTFYELEQMVSCVSRHRGRRMSHSACCVSPHTIPVVSLANLLSYCLCLTRVNNLTLLRHRNVFPMTTGNIFQHGCLRNCY